MYEYRARIVRVVDGDSIYIDVDMGFETTRRMGVRLLGIDAPEMSTLEGKAARGFLVSELPVGLEVMIRTVKDKREKYGRYLATILVDEINVNDLMVSEGFARYYTGGAR